MPGQQFAIEIADLSIERNHMRGQRRKRIASEWRQARILMISKYIE